MAERLSVFLLGDYAGEVSVDRGTLRLAFDEQWVETSGRQQLSLSLPKAAMAHDGDAVAAYLWGLLPDNDAVLRRWAADFQTTLAHPLGLLRHVGLDCAGAVQFAQGSELPTRGSSSEPYSAAAIARHIRELQHNPTAWLIGAAGEERSSAGRFSLAGAQEKFALAERDGEWFVPIGDAASTHIFKPDLGDAHPGLPEVEHVTMAAARQLGLSVAPTRLLEYDGIRTVIVERFDRSAGGVRLHAEDFCQARGAHPSAKYQAEGGPGIAELIDTIGSGVIRQRDRLDDRAELWRHIAFGALTGATDAHAKNFSLLLDRGGARLAPGYDMSSYLPYADVKDRSLRLAMKVGGTYAFYEVTEANVLRAAASLSLEPEWALDEWRRIREALPAAISAAVDALRSDGLDPDRTADYAERLAAWQASPARSIGNGRPMPASAAPPRAVPVRSARAPRTADGQFRPKR